MVKLVSGLLSLGVLIGCSEDGAGGEATRSPGLRPMVGGAVSGPPKPYAARVSAGGRSSRAFVGTHCLEHIPTEDSYCSDSYAASGPGSRTLSVAATGRVTASFKARAVRVSAWLARKAAGDRLVAESGRVSRRARGRGRWRWRVTLPPGLRPGTRMLLVLDVHKYHNFRGERVRFTNTVRIAR